jgi:ATP-dependent DNA helicase RecG
MGVWFCQRPGWNDLHRQVGIVADVNLHQTAEGEFIAIIVEAYPNPVNYKGQYHYRSGSTKQELKGAALDKFLLQKQGKRWDGMPIPNVSASDLKPETFELFRRRGLKSRRIGEDSLSDTNERLLENLKLTENGFLKRAALLLFHPDPENFVTGAYIKIGYFETDADLRFQDEVHGNLFEQIEKTVDLLFTKYIKAEISYEGIHRIETYEYPKDAVREALLNAISHKDYSGNIPIQISVYKDKIMLWNMGRLPENWTIETLLGKHSSQPYNPDISNAFFRSGYIEAWGRGITKMTEQCARAGLPKPLLTYNGGNDFWVIFRKDIYNAEYLNDLGLNERQVKAVLYAKEKGKITNKEYQELNSVSRRTATNDLTELVDNFKILIQSGTHGAGSFYEIIAHFVR